MTLSIVVTTYNRAETVCRLLASLGDQSDMDFEVVVAIDGSTDDTQARLASLDLPFPMRWVDTGYRGYGLALARNLGILESRGKGVAILDDDSFPAPGFVTAHKAALTEGVISGGPRPPSDPRAERMRWKADELMKLPARVPLPIAEIRSGWPNVYLIENNISMLREDWIRIGLFSERLRLYGFIGQEFFARAAHFGFRYQLVPEALVCHHGELEGDNGVSRRRKLRQVRMAKTLRPSLLQPVHFQAQVAWARARAEGRTPDAFPSFWRDLVLSLPGRAVGRIGRGRKLV